MKTFLTHFVVSFAVAYSFFSYSELIPYNATTAFAVFMVAFVLLWLSSPLYHKAYFRKLPKAIGFVFYFLKEVLIANLKIAYDIVTPRYIMKPAVMALPLDVKENLDITLLACMISLTPGSLTLDVRDDRRVLYVHTLYVEHGDLEKLKRLIKNGFERRILELTT